METSEGPIEITMYREWSPLAVDRAHYLMANDFYAGARFYRVVPGFVAQWGLTGKPVLDSLWQDRGIDDEPVVDSNARGTPVDAFAKLRIAPPDRLVPDHERFTVRVLLRCAVELPPDRRV